MSKVSDYIPRKCDATHRIIGAKDHASVQFNIANVDGKGVFTQSYSTICLSGFVRKEGIADAQVNRIAAERGLIKDLTKFPGQEKFVNSK